jgi:hypothetical protein
LWPAAVCANAKKKKQPPKLGMRRCSARYDQQPFYLLKPEARLARAVVEFDPTHALDDP